MFVDSEILLEHASTGLMMLDSEGVIIFTNPFVSEITGYGSNELLRRHLHILFADRDDSMQAEYDLALARKTGGYRSEGWRIRKDGSSFWGEMVITAVRDNLDHKRTAAFVVVLLDTTLQKNTEIKIRKREEQYRLMVEEVKDYSIFMLDHGGYVRTWNEGGKKLTGYLPDEIIGKHFSVFYTSNDAKAGRPENEIRVATATGKYEEEGWRVRKDGSVFWASVVLTRLYNQHNELIGFSKVTRDLSEKKANEEKLRQSEERYRSLVEQVTDYGIFMMDERGRIISWNEGARRINGYTHEEIVGKYFSIFYPEEDIIKRKPEMELEVAKRDGKYEEEGWRLKKDGSRFWANVVITSVYNPEGLLIGYSKVTRDLTERKTAEQALRDSYERYRELANELKVTNSELSYTNTELEQFTSIVSHDLQEPIRTIKSFLQLIEMKLGPQNNPDLNTYITKSINATNRMRELIRNLLHYSQLSKDELVEEEVDVEELVSVVMQNLRTSIEQSGAEIRTDLQLRTVLGDRIQLEQLLQNLVGNAIKFTDNTRPEVIIGCVKEGNSALFSVKDNGIGISPEDKHKVFDIFRRLETKKEYSGTGIGLAICKKIIERHGGRIWLESQRGAGTTFYFTLRTNSIK